MPAIANQNPKDLTLPDTRHHRGAPLRQVRHHPELRLSYFKDAARDDWSYDLSENWPNEVGQGAKGTSGVISTVQAGRRHHRLRRLLPGRRPGHRGRQGRRRLRRRFSAEAGRQGRGGLPARRHPPRATTASSSSSTTTPPRPRAPTRLCWSPTTSPARPYKDAKHRQVRQVLAHLRDQRRRPEDRSASAAGSAPLPSTLRPRRSPSPSRPSRPSDARRPARVGETGPVTER